MDFSDVTNPQSLEIALSTDSLNDVFGLLVKRLAASNPQIAGMYLRFSAATEMSSYTEENALFRLLVADVVRVLADMEPKHFSTGPATPANTQEIFYPLAVSLTAAPPFIEETAPSQVSDQADAQYIFWPEAQPQPGAEPLVTYPE